MDLGFPGIHTRRSVGLLALMGLALLSLAAPAGAAFPGQNGKIAFWSTRDDPRADLYSIDPDGTALTRLGVTTATEELAAWSPDGTKIAFDGNSDGDYEIYLMNADGTGVTQLTHNSARDQFPAWSPDGRKIVFESSRAGGSEIFVMNADGTSVSGLTESDPYDVGSPEWSPDGQRIAFIKEGVELVCNPEDECSLVGEINLMRPDGTDVISTGILSDFRAKWSPDGDRLAYAKYVEGNYEIYTVRPDGTGEVRVTNQPHADHAPTWSPDGTRIAYQTTRDDPNWQTCATAVCLFKIYSVRVDGTGNVPITTGPGRDGAPDWQPLPAPERGDYKNAAHFCKAEREHFGADAFRQRYGGGANAFGNCVSRS